MWNTISNYSPAMAELIAFLIIFPMASAVPMLFIKNNLARKMLVIFSASVVISASLLLLGVSTYSETAFRLAHGEKMGHLLSLGSVALNLFVFYVSLKHRRFKVFALAVLQACIVFYTEFRYPGNLEPDHHFFIDRFSTLMALIVGVVGGIICIYALDYMKDFHAHFRKEVQDRRRTFFFVIFLFLGAMFGVIFSNYLPWMFFFWEITTVSSFLLIGYKRNEESINNAFLALYLNLIGGVAFAIALLIPHVFSGTLEIDRIMHMHAGGGWVIMLPVALIAFAGLTKSAQMPFSGWLLGAMVAPTPVSALLHSSTMVKAGIYVIVRFSLVFENSKCGLFLALVGAATFMVTSFVAVSQSDAKKVLAYSTIANLGLIVLCAGIGTYEAVWAAMMLIMFHAVSKCLLFMCVGTVEHKIHSRNIEDMAGLIVRMPKISIMMQIGMAGMFLAPFGMLISKWAVIKAMLDLNPILTICMVFGGTATMFFWVKWMGKLLIVARDYDKHELKIGRYETFSLSILSALTVVLCAFFPAVSAYFVEPYLVEIFNKTFSIGEGNILIMCIMLSLVMLFPLSFINYGKRVKVVDPYLCGANTHEPTRFTDSFGNEKEFGMNNYYLEKQFNEKSLIEMGSVLSIMMIILMIGVSFLK